MTQVLSVYSREENIGEELLSRVYMGRYRSDGYVWHATVKVRGGSTVVAPAVGVVQSEPFWCRVRSCCRSTALSGVWYWVRCAGLGCCETSRCLRLVKHGMIRVTNVLDGLFGCAYYVSNCRSLVVGLLTVPCRLYSKSILGELDTFQAPPSRSSTFLGASNYLTSHPQKRRIRLTCFKGESRTPAASQRKMPAFPTRLTHKISQVIDLSCCLQQMIGLYATAPCT